MNRLYCSSERPKTSLADALALAWAVALVLAIIAAIIAPALLLGDTPAALPAGLAIVSTTPLAPVAPPQTSPWLLLISIGVPMAVTVVKGLIPNLHKAWLPIIAASVGLVLALVDHFTGALGNNPYAVLLLGAAGTGLREIADQVNQVLKAPTIPPAVSALLMVAVLTGSTIVLSGVMVGCAGQSSERTTLTTVHAALGAIDIGEQAYEADLVASEVKDGKAKHADERAKYLDTVAKFQVATKGALNAWAALHGTDSANPTPEQLAEVNSEFATAQAELVAIIAPYLPKVK